MTETEFTYWAFLSYSQEDNCGKRPDSPDMSRHCWGDRWHDLLKSFAIPAEFTGQVNARAEIIPERIAPIFQDAEEQSGNASLSEGTRTALDQSRYLIVICSPRSAQSLHVNEVVRYYKQLGRGNRILPIVIDGEPHASDGNKPGISPETECFVPALLYPVKPDGTFDTSRQDRGSIFADARQGADKREILGQDDPNGQIELETAKIQLIAGLLGVGFNGLWAREQKRRFSEVRVPDREVRHSIQETQSPSPEAQREVLEAQNQVRVAQQQIEELQNQAREAQSKVLEAQRQAQEALDQIAEARNQAREAESKVLEAQHQAQESQQQLEAARNEVRDAQNKVLEIQNLPQDVQSQIQEAQDKAREIQSQLAEARSQAREAQNKVLEAQEQSRETQNQVQELQGKSREAESQLAEARSRLEEFQGKILEAHAQAREAQNQSEEARNQVREAQSKIEEIENIARQTQSQLETARNQFQAAESKILETQNQATETQKQLEEARNQARITRNQVQELQTKTLAARRLTKVFAVMAVLALMSAGINLRQRKTDSEAPAKPVTAEVRAAAPASVPPTPEQIQQALQKIGGAGQDQSRLLADWSAQQPEGALKWLESQPDSESLPAGTWRSTMIAGLFDTWAAKDLEAASTACEQLTEGPAKEKARESILIRRMAKAPASAAATVKNLEPGDNRQKAIAELCAHWAGVDAPAALAWAQSLADEPERIGAINRVIAHWAHKDPQSAGQFANQHPDLSATALGEIAAAWFQRDVTATTNWVAGLPDGEKKDAARQALVETWAQNDPKGVITYALGLPAGDMRTRYLTEGSRQLAICDLPGTVALLQSVSDAALRQRLLEQAARNCDLPHLNPAAKYIAAMPASDDQKAAIAGLIAKWTPADPETAVNWLGSFPETNAQPEQVQSVIKAWAQPEPAAAARWLARLPEDKVDEGTVSAFLEGAVQRYPEFAGQWTQSVTNEARRQKYQVQVARQWLKTDPSAASRWIDSLNLPEEIKQSLDDSLDNF